MSVRPLEAGDLDAVLTLNQAHVPEVSSLDRDRLDAIVADASLAVVAIGPEDQLEGFVLVLAPGADYASPNYRWFEERYDDHRYVDRIAVDTGAQGRGTGRALYEAVFDHARAAGSPRVTCEVNVDPPNPTSMAFHAALGFTEVGRQDTYDGSVRVALLVCDL